MDGPSLLETCCPDDRSTIWLGPGGQAAYLGPSLALGPHSGSVACLALGVDAPFVLHVGDARLPSVRSALVPARTEHRVVAATGARMLFLYLDPRSPHVAVLRDAMIGRTSGIAWGHHDESRLARHVREDGGADLSRLVGAAAPPADPRVDAALSILQGPTGGRISAAELASQVHLSRSRFLHLFTTGTGTSFRRYRLWTRMFRVVHAVDRGVDVTTAAVEAGYASSSHFSDAFRSTFGLSLTSLMARPTSVVVTDGPPGTADDLATDGGAQRSVPRGRPTPRTTRKGSV